MTWLRGNNFPLYTGSKAISTTSANLQTNLDIATSDLWKGTPSWAYEGLYLLSVLNPASYTDVTCVVYNKHANFDTTNTRYGELTRFTVPYTSDGNNAVDKLVQGAFIGDGLRLGFINASTAGSTAGSSNVTMYVRVMKP